MQSTKTKFKEIFLFYTKTYNEQSLLWIYRNIKQYVLENGIECFYNEIVTKLEKLSLKNYNIASSMIDEIEKIVFEIEGVKKDLELEYIIKKCNTYSIIEENNKFDKNIKILNESKLDNTKNNFYSIEDKKTNENTVSDNNVNLFSNDFLNNKCIDNNNCKNIPFDKNHKFTTEDCEEKIFVLENAETCETIETEFINEKNTELNDKKLQCKTDDHTINMIKKPNTLEANKSEKNELELKSDEICFEKIKKDEFKSEINAYEFEKNNVEINNIEKSVVINQKPINNTIIKQENVQNDTVNEKLESNTSKSKLESNKITNDDTKKLSITNNIKLDTKQEELVCLYQNMNEIMNDKEFNKFILGLCKIIKPLLSIKARESINLLVHLSLKTNTDVLEELIEIYFEKKDWLIEIYLYIAFVKNKKNIETDFILDKCKILILEYIKKNDPSETFFTCSKSFNFLKIKLDPDLFLYVKECMQNGDMRIKFFCNQNIDKIIHLDVFTIEENINVFFNIIFMQENDIIIDFFKNKRIFESFKKIPKVIFSKYLELCKLFFNSYYDSFKPGHIEYIITFAQIFIYFLRSYQNEVIKKLFITFISISDMYLKERIKIIFGNNLAEIYETFYRKLEKIDSDELIEQISNEYMSNNENNFYLNEEANVKRFNLQSKDYHFNFLNTENFINEQKFIQIEKNNDEKKETNCNFKIEEFIEAKNNDKYITTDLINLKNVHKIENCENENIANLFNNNDKNKTIDFNNLENEENTNSIIQNELNCNKNFDRKIEINCNSFLENINEVTEKLENLKLSKNINLVNAKLQLHLKNFAFNYLSGHESNIFLLIKEIKILIYMEDTKSILNQIYNRIEKWRYKKLYIEKIYENINYFGEDGYEIIEKYTKDTSFFVRKMAQDYLDLINCN
ncbi:hypothetical protein GVAV_001853 [Gurleya vavrai]